MNILAFSIVSLWIAVLVGYIANIVGVISMSVAGAALTTLFLGKLVGVVIFPLGVVLGYFGMFS
jgi:hypothetical protein